MNKPGGVSNIRSMIPDFVNVDDLAQQLESGDVAVGLDPATASGIDPEQVKNEISPLAEGSPVGDIGVVYLDRTPAMTADLRDIAQELSTKAPQDIIIVRAPGSGAVVSDNYSRADLETAQHALLSHPELSTGLQAFTDTLTHQSTPWPLINAGIAAVAATAALIAFMWERLHSAT